MRSQRYLSLWLALWDRFNLILLLLQVFHRLSLLHWFHHLYCIVDGTLSWPSTLLLHWLLWILHLRYNSLIGFRYSLLSSNHITWDFCLMTPANDLFCQRHMIRALGFVHLGRITYTILPDLITILGLSIHRSFLAGWLDLRLHIAWSCLVSLRSCSHFAATE